jgi:hypothetical protein
MSDLFKTLNYKDRMSLLVVDAPASFERELNALDSVKIDRKPKPKNFYDFAIGFAVTQAELDRVSATLAAASRGDAVVWVAYPKKSSKCYRCEFDRDSGWQALGDAGFEGVRMVAIDEDWSALRFRRVEFIQSLKRDSSRAMSAEGRKRISETGRPKKMADRRHQPASLDAALEGFYRKHGFGESIGRRPLTVPVYTGCLLVPMPNIETRRVFLKYHDLHHLITGYSVGRIGEGEVSAWELGTGSMFVSPTLGAMNLIALSTGLFLQPRRMWRAFLRGCRSENIYRAAVREDIDRGRWRDLDSLRASKLETACLAGWLPLRACEFTVYAAIALIIHAVIALPAVILRFVTDVSLGHTVFQAVKPKKRNDLY